MRTIAALILLTGIPSASPMDPPPAWLPLPEGYTQTSGLHLAFNRDELRCPRPDSRDGGEVKVEGEQWRFNLRGPMAAGQKPEPREAVFPLFQKKLEAEGWKYVSRPPFGCFHWVKGGKEAWADLGVFSSQDVRIRVLEKGLIGRALDLPEPAVEPKPWKEGEAPEYLAPYPGGKLAQAKIAPKTGFEVTRPSDPERTWVGSPMLSVRYELPRDLSVIEFDTVFVAALEKAGWALLGHTPAAVTSGGAVFWAHYTKKGRDLWMAGSMTSEHLAVSIADVGMAAASRALKDALDKQGRVALYGIYFDLDKATLRNESEPTLQQVLALLKGEPKLALKVEGHTDNTGARPHNQTLSEERAASVKAWLTAHGVDAARLATVGFADTKPVADNATPEGRSKNRRVELSKP
ncbi:MAG: OmpA family protein [Deltaproteobacteria bacterium]|nr:OmpA family protein [Deltaproteobacteria bacterium]